MASKLHSLPFWLRAMVIVAAVLLTGCANQDGAETDPAAVAAADASAADENGMAGDMMAMPDDAPRLPPVTGYYDGEQVLFVHPEASDVEIAQTLEGMMGSAVPVVASLSQVPREARSSLYVFTNGVAPDDAPRGPLGFQPGVFATAPGDDEYTPLQDLMLVTWNDGTDSRLLTSAAEVEGAQAAGEITVERPDVVINAPLLTWPDGRR